MLPSEYVALGWCKFMLAMNNVGQIVGINSSDAVKWCALGAISRFAQNDNQLYYQYVAELSNIVGMPAQRWNDFPHRTQQEVVSVLKEVEKNLNLVNHNENIETISNDHINELLKQVNQEILVAVEVK